MRSESEVAMPNANHKILIIDDDKIASAALEGLLSSEPYELYFAYNGLDGISMAVSIHPEIIPAGCDDAKNGRV